MSSSTLGLGLEDEDNGPSSSTMPFESFSWSSPCMLGRTFMNMIHMVFSSLSALRVVHLANCEPSQIHQLKNVWHNCASHGTVSSQPAYLL